MGFAHTTCAYCMHIAGTTSMALEPAGRRRCRNVTLAGPGRSADRSAPGQRLSPSSSARSPDADVRVLSAGSAQNRGVVNGTRDRVANRLFLIGRYHGGPSRHPMGARGIEEVAVAVVSAHGWAPETASKLFDEDQLSSLGTIDRRTALRSVTEAIVRKQMWEQNPDYPAMANAGAWSAASHVDDGYLAAPTSVKDRLYVIGQYHGTSRDPMETGGFKRSPTR